MKKRKTVDVMTYAMRDMMHVIHAMTETAEAEDLSQDDKKQGLDNAGSCDFFMNISLYEHLIYTCSPQTGFCYPDVYAFLILSRCAPA